LSQGTLPLYALNGRNLEDFVTWVDSSKIKRNIMKYSDKVFLLTMNADRSLTILIYCDCDIVCDTRAAEGMVRNGRN
jgi:hypothetical protein